MKVLKYGFNKKDKELNLRMTNNTITNCSSLASARYLFFSSSREDSHQVRTVITLERLMVFDFNAHVALQVDMIQVVAASKRWPGDLLHENL